MKSSKPVIGIIPDFKEGQKGLYSVKNFYALRVNHVEMINKNGGAAIILPYDYGLIDDYLNSIDAILIVGGYFDINPKRYGEAIHPEVKLNEVRENFEYAIAKKALAKNMPFLGICNGLALINVLRNGSAISIYLITISILITSNLILKDMKITKPHIMILLLMNHRNYMKL